ncbi:hypothetical protein GCM10010515_48390 [Streptomyces fructofermentans]|uniref:Uncharacterized protein n=1 Tax=Streptomyces fructofermentans TaxID=152141 RepID=A0A918KVI2_9ACTN|nr:hypothetical protein GCM10010515_48390 [Streptomyces fructofermentans]
MRLRGRVRGAADAGPVAATASGTAARAAVVACLRVSDTAVPFRAGNGVPPGPSVRVPDGAAESVPCVAGRRTS